MTDCRQILLEPEDVLNAIWRMLPVDVVE